ncbi:hypothetical protein DV737_g2167, partial [Chaetothyriales sp. CBS 132003]
MESALVVGCTGLVGAQIVANLLANPRVFSSVHTISRRALANSPATTSAAAAALHPYESKDTQSWAPHISSISPPPSAFFSALGTTRAAAGGFDNQYKLEHGLNIELAKAAKAAGTKIYVLISASGANKNSFVPYSRMKGEIEEDIKQLDFDHTVILQPALICGKREESRPAEALFQGLAAALGSLNQKYLKDTWAQDDVVIARAAVAAAEKLQTGQQTDKVWVLGGSEIIKLGRTEWKAQE